MSEPLFASDEVDGRSFVIEVRPGMTRGNHLAIMVRFFGSGYWREATDQPHYFTEYQDAVDAGNRWLHDGQRPRELPPVQREPLDTHGYVMQAGKHRGDLITRVPVGYLKWMVRERHREAQWAAAELKRRGTVTPDIEISGHAIDSASLRVRKIWHATRHENEGLHAWLVRVAQEALAADPDGDKITHGGIVFVFEKDGAWPLLKTVMREKGGRFEASRGEEINAE